MAALAGILLIQAHSVGWKVNCLLHRRIDIHENPCQAWLLDPLGHKICVTLVTDIGRRWIQSSHHFFKEVRPDHGFGHGYIGF